MIAIRRIQLNFELSIKCVIGPAAQVPPWMNTLIWPLEEPEAALYAPLPQQPAKIPEAEEAAILADGAGAIRGWTVMGWGAYGLFVISISSSWGGLVGAPT